MDKAEKRARDRGVQILRIAACIAVFICHFGQRMQLYSLSDNLYSLSQLGRRGVELFFVLSGYLACFSLAGGGSAVRFYKKRMIRILPLYYFCILYYFITETFIFKSVPADPMRLGWLRYVFCLNGIVPARVEFWSNLGITWTIPMFFWFFVLAPLLVRLSKTTLRSVIVLAVAIAAACVIKLKIDGWLNAIVFLPCFLIGIVVYNAKKEGRRFGAAVGLLVFVLVGKFCEWTGLASRLAEISELYFASAIFASMVLFSEEATVGKAASAKTLDVLDEHSYTFYLVHGITFCGLIDKIGDTAFHSAAAAIAIKLVAATALTVLLTYVVHRFIEEPIRKKLSELLLR